MNTEHDRLRKALRDQVAAIPVVATPLNQSADFDSALVVPVLEVKRGNSENELKIAISRCGLVVLIRKGNYRRSGNRHVFPFEVEIVEQPALNRFRQGSGVNGDVIAEKVGELVHGWEPFEQYSSALDYNVANKEGTNEVSTSIQFNFQAVYFER